MSTKKHIAPVDDPISGYAKGGSPELASVCDSLRKSIDASLPQAASKIWHAIPVWFIGDNPVVGYTAKKDVVSLMFWNGKNFAEPALKPVGKFEAAEIRYANVS